MVLLVFDDVLLRLARGRQRLLDIGCGRGDLRLLLEERGWRGTYVGLDLKRYASVVGDAQRLPFRSGFFDIVVFIQSLEHVPDYFGALQEAWRVLRGGGVLFVQAPCCESWVATGIQDHLHVLHPVTLSRLLRRIGFSGCKSVVEGDFMAVWAVRE